MTESTALTDSRTALCAHCATLIRFWPAIDTTAGDDADGGTWRHVSLDQGRDHAPEPMPEGVARAMYGDR